MYVHCVYYYNDIVTIQTDVDVVVYCIFRLLLSELFPFRNGPPHSVSKPEFSNMVNSLSVTMETEEMEKLWRK